MIICLFYKKNNTFVVKSIFMKIARNYLNFLIGIAFLCLLEYFLQTKLAYLFFYREQEQLFLWNSDIILDQLKHIGGFSILVGQFFVQFFVVPKLGAIITTIVLGLTSLLLWLTIKKSPHADFAFPLSFLPATFQVILLADVNYHYDGVIALLMVSLFLFIYKQFKPSKSISQILWGSGLTMILFFLTGPAAILFCICLFCLDFINIWEKGIILFIACLLGYISVLTTSMNDFRFAFLPDAYYESLLTPDKIYLISWFSLPVSLLISRLSVYAQKWKKIIKISMEIILIFFLFYNTIDGFATHQDEKFYQLIKLEYLEANEQWDEIIQTSEESSHNYLYCNYQNLALAHKGELIKHLFDYSQNGPFSLVVENNKSKEVTQLLSQIYFTIGNIAAAQNMAFESNAGAIGKDNPEMMKLLIQTNLILGAYPVAEKYIHLLEQSWKYRQWASEQRKFLYNDHAIEADSLLGMKRRDLPQKADFIYLDGFIADAEHTIQVNPKERCAMEYVEAYLLLSKDMRGIKYIVEKYGGTPALVKLPSIMQEAVISYAEKDPNYCTKHGVTEETFERYRDYKQKYIECRNFGRNPADELHAEYGNSYWYYLMFKQ